MEKAGKSSGKRHKVLDDEQNVDRLSDLPDGIICHILSFLTTKPSVSTSILAKRWRFLWAHIPVLDFDSWYYDSEQATSFPSIVCTVIMRHKVQSLNTFRLFCSDKDGPKGCYELETCISTAIDRNVKKLELRLQVELPRCILTCKTLVDVRLYDGVIIPPSSGPISLPSLKKLCFYSAEDDVHLPSLLSGCPVLEKLTICGPPCFNFGGCTLFSSTLQSLTLDFPPFGTITAYDIPGFRLKINAPALRYLEVHDYMYHHISASPMNSLVEADICLDTFVEFGELYPRCVLEFLNSLCNVKRLKLSGDEDEDLNIPVPGSIAKFGNLTKLEVFANWCFLSKFLESADHLQVLIIREGGWHSQHWMEPTKERCASLSYSLRSVRIDDFMRKEQAFNMVRYILRNALVLKRMEIHCQQWRGVGLKEKYDAIQRIALFP